MQAQEIQALLEQQLAGTSATVNVMGNHIDITIVGDIFVGVTQEDFLKAIDLIKNIGFSEKLDTLRTDSLCMMTSSTYNEDVAVQLVANGSEHESFLEFRDKLRSNPDLVSRYNQLKFDCKGLAHDNYREVKSAFIETVLKTH